VLRYEEEGGERERGRGRELVEEDREEGGEKISRRERLELGGRREDGKRQSQFFYRQSLCTTTACPTICPPTLWSNIAPAKVSLPPPPLPSLLPPPPSFLPPFSLLLVLLKDRLYTRDNLPSFLLPSSLAPPSFLPCFVSPQ
jgi:hypothetical protein